MFCSITGDVCTFVHKCIAVAAPAASLCLESDPIIPGFARKFIPHPHHLSLHTGLERPPAKGRLSNHERACLEGQVSGVRRHRARQRIGGYICVYVVISQHAGANHVFFI